MQAFEMNEIEFETLGLFPKVTYYCIVFLCVQTIILTICVHPICIGLLIPLVGVLRFNRLEENNPPRWRHAWGI